LFHLEIKVVRAMMLNCVVHIYEEEDTGILLLLLVLNLYICRDKLKAWIELILL
jgi:hypothetical protein